MAKFVVDEEKALEIGRTKGPRAEQYYREGKNRFGITFEKMERHRELIRRTPSYHETDPVKAKQNAEELRKRFDGD